MKTRWNTDVAFKLVICLKGNLFLELRENKFVQEKDEGRLLGSDAVGIFEICMCLMFLTLTPNPLNLFIFHVLRIDIQTNTRRFLSLFCVSFLRLFETMMSLFVLLNYSDIFFYKPALTFPFPFI